MSNNLDNIFDHLFDDISPNSKEPTPTNEKEFIELNQEKYSELSDNQDIIIGNSSLSKTQEDDEVINFFSSEYKSDIQSKSIRNAIAATVMQKRENLGYGRKEFGKYLGIKHKIIFKIETSDYDFSIDELIDLCNKLNIKLEVNISI